jgi:hypothetical protein
VLPFFSTTSSSAVFGVLLAFIFFMIYRETTPYRHWFNNLLVVTAQGDRVVSVVSVVTILLCSHTQRCSCSSSKLRCSSTMIS